MIPKVSDVYGDVLETPPPSLTRGILAVGAPVWLLAFVVTAGLVLWKDSWKTVRLPNSVVAMALTAVVGILIAAFLLPIIEILRFLAD
jgi:hypothetical protein